jgi:hypothetical protein
MMVGPSLTPIQAELANTHKGAAVKSCGAERCSCPTSPFYPLSTMSHAGLCVYAVDIGPYVPYALIEYFYAVSVRMINYLDEKEKRH